jgi:hypothetical protein
VQEHFQEGICLTAAQGNAEVLTRNQIMDRHLLILSSFLSPENSLGALLSL